MSADTGTNSSPNDGLGTEPAANESVHSQAPETQSIRAQEGASRSAEYGPKTRSVAFSGLSEAMAQLATIGARVMSPIDDGEVTERIHRARSGAVRVKSRKEMTQKSLTNIFGAAFDSISLGYGPATSRNLLSMEQAISLGDLDRVKEILKLDRMASLRPITRNNTAPLIQAIMLGNAELATILLDNGADPNTIGPSGASVLHMASFYGEHAVVEALLKKGANIEAFDESGCTVLQAAARDNDFLLARLVLDYGADIEATGRNVRRTPIELAAGAGNLEVAAELVNRGCRLFETLEPKLLTLAVRAVQKDSVKSVGGKGEGEGGGEGSNDGVSGSSSSLVKALIRCGSVSVASAPESGSGEVVSSTTTATAGSTTTTTSTTTGGESEGEGEGVRGKSKSEIPFSFLSSPSSSSSFTTATAAPLPMPSGIHKITSLMGYTVMHHAAAMGNESLIDDFMSLGADIEALNSLRQTPLHTASVVHSLSGVEHLLKKGANPNPRVGTGRRLRALDQCDDADIQQVLIRATEKRAKSRSKGKEREREGEGEGEREGEARTPPHIGAVGGVLGVHLSLEEKEEEKEGEGGGGVQRKERSVSILTSEGEGEESVSDEEEFEQNLSFRLHGGSMVDRALFAYKKSSIYTPFGRLKQGYMEKQEGFKAFKRRFFVLRRGSLEVYNSSEDDSPSSAISVEDAELKVADNSDTVFELRSNGKKHIIRARTATERARWMKAIEESYLLSTPPIGKGKEKGEE